MKTYNTEEEVNAELDDYGNLKIEDDVMFLCDVKIDGNIIAWDVIAGNIDAKDIYAHDIAAINIDAQDIIYDGICSAIETFVCKSIRGRSQNSEHFCLNGEIVFKGESNKNEIDEFETLKALEVFYETHREGLEVLGIWGEIEDAISNGVHFYNHNKGNYENEKAGIEPWGNGIADHVRERDL